MLRNSEIEKALLRDFNREIVNTTGCTDPGSVCFAVASAKEMISGEVDSVDVLVSRNIYKNGISVKIPGTGKAGLDLAAALGLFFDCAPGLDMLSSVNDDLVKAAEEKIKSGKIKVFYDDTPEALYVRANIKGLNGECASAIISKDYSKIARLEKNGEIIFENQESIREEVPEIIKYSVEELYNTILSADSGQFDMLYDAAVQNFRAVSQDIESSEMRLGKNIRAWTDNLSGVHKVAAMVQASTAAAAEARMEGLCVEIVSIAGSGNHGITNFAGVLAAAEALLVDIEKTKRALAISSMITIYIKAYIKRMTAFCGCGSAAATGLAAATAYLLGGAYKESLQAMNTVIGTIAGMFCDGAKGSCAYKLSISASFAVQAAYMAMENCAIEEGIGIVGNSIEETFENIGRLNNPGMLETDREILKIVDRKNKAEKEYVKGYAEAGK